MYFWVGRSRRNSAGVILVARHLYVSGVTPLGAPRVLDYPVILPRLGSPVPNNKDGMIQVHWVALTFWIIEHTWKRWAGYLYCKFEKWKSANIRRQDERGLQARGLT